jgi:cytochrome c-type biogenesis protein CcmF
MFLGFTGASWNVDHEASLLPGESTVVANYKLTYAGEHMDVDNSKRMIFADLDVSKDGQQRARLSPAKFIYKKQPDSPETKVAISHGFRDDVYVIVGTINPQTKMAAFQIHVNPLVSWIWFGCLILISGSLVCMWPQFEFGESRVWAGARGVAATAASVMLGIMLAATPTARAQTPPAPAMPAMPQGTGTVHIENTGERAIFGALRCMCGCAGDTLSTCTCSSAEEARGKIREKLKAGEKADEIIAEYAAEYGSDAYAVPPNRGALRAIFIVPVVAISLGAVGLAGILRRWRGTRGPSTHSESAPGARTASRPASDAYDARLDDELKDLDG